GGTSRPSRAGGTQFLPAWAGSARPSIEHGLDGVLPVGCQGHTPACSPLRASRPCAELLTPSAPGRHHAPHASVSSRWMLGRTVEASERAPSLERAAREVRAEGPVEPPREVSTARSSAFAVWSCCTGHSQPLPIVHPSPIRLASLARAIVRAGASQRYCV